MIYETEEIKKLVKAGDLPQITEDNYYSNEIAHNYMSFHRWLSFHGSLGVPGCEAKAVAELNGEYEEDKVNDAFLIGGYIDAYLVGSEAELEQYKRDHPEMFVTRGERKGELQAKYLICEKMIERCKRDELFMAFLNGEHQSIFAAVMFGIPWCCKLDSYIPGKLICDLKSTREMHKQFYIPDFGHVDFISYYSYVQQLAIYRELVRLNTDETLPCFIAAVSKSNHPEIKVIHVDDVSLYDALIEVENSCDTGSIPDVWRGLVDPIRCNRPECEYCVDTEVLKDPINYKELIMGD